jgi:hypothetical protein
LKTQSEKTGDWSVPASIMSIDARRIRNLFNRHRRQAVQIAGLCAIIIALAMVVPIGVAADAQW